MTDGNEVRNSIYTSVAKILSFFGIKALELFVLARYITSRYTRVESDEFQLDWIIHNSTRCSAAFAPIFIPNVDSILASRKYERSFC